MSYQGLRSLLPKNELWGFVILALLLVVVLPLSMDIFRLNLVGKYLTYAFVAVGLVLCWGYGGILSLGQGVFFGLGGYIMAMFLKLEASDPESTKIQSTPGIPDFMDWNQITELPFFWEPFYSFTFTLLAIIVIPSIFAYIIGDVQATGGRCLLRDYHPGDSRNPHHPDYWPAGLHRWRQWDYRSAHVAWMGHPHR
jgi:urea transport system permease protein